MTEQNQGEAAHQRRSALDFQLFWIGSSLSALGTRLSAFAYPLLVLALYGSVTDAGLIGFTSSLPYLIFQLPAGALVDRWNRKTVMIVCDAGRALLLGSIPLALFFGVHSLAQLMVVSFLEGALSVFYSLCEPGAIRNIVPPERLGSALSQVEARERGAGLLGQPLGGFFYGMGRSVPFLADAVSYTLSLVTLLLIRQEFGKERTEPPAGEQTNLGAEILAGLRWLWNQPFIRAAALLIASSNMLFRMLVLMIIVIAEQQGASATTIGIVLTASGVGGLLGALVAPWCEQRLPKKAVVIGVNWVWALLMPLLAVFDNLYVLGGIFGLMAFVGPIWNVAIRVYQLSITPEELLGRAESASFLLAFGAIPLGSLVGGYMLETFGPRTTALAMAAAMLVIAIAATVAPAIRKAALAPAASNESASQGVATG